MTVLSTRRITRIYSKKSFSKWVDISPIGLIAIQMGKTNLVTIHQDRDDEHYPTGYDDQGIWDIAQIAAWLDCTIADVNLAIDKLKLMS